MIPTSFNRLGTGGKGLPPDGYTPLKALRATGSQIIDVGIAPSSDYDLNINFKFITISIFQSPYASYLPVGASHRHFNAMLNSSSSVCSLSKNATQNLYAQSFPALASNIPYSLIIKKGEATAMLNNASGFYTDYNLNYSDESPNMLLFEGFDGEIEHFDFATATEATSLRPYLDNNNRPCMWCSIRKITIYNTGTGEFEPIYI